MAAQEFRGRLALGAQQPTVREALKIAGAGALYARGVLHLRRSDVFPVDNIFGCTIQKAGSQWLKALLSHPIVARQTGLSTFPQFRYDEGQFVRRFPRGTFVPGLYLSLDEYSSVVKPPNFKTIYVVRDPRQIVVSWYYSMLESHRDVGRVLRVRNALRHLELEDGMTYAILDLAYKLNEMRPWWLDPPENTLLLRLEEAELAPEETIARILTHCEIDLDDQERSNLCDAVSKERLREQDAAIREPGQRSHYRQSGDHRKLSARNLSLLRGLTGDLVEILGYETR